VVNRLFRKMGLNGKAVLPMVLGLGCDTMATLTTRILESRKERLIVTLLLALAVPCSAQLGVVLGMIRARQHAIGMHAEFGTVSAETASALNAVRARGGRIVAVGSTALRLLESAVGMDGRLGAFSGETSIFITPGYEFRAIDLMLTNFHLPRSTLFMLVSAFSGLDTMKRAYAHAIQSGYRFYSYGDACLLYPQP